MSMNPTAGSGVAYQAMRLQAMAWLVFGRQAEAAVVFDKMLERWPEDPYALASRSHLSAQAERFDEAIADSLVLVASWPQRSAADWFNLAFLLEKRDRLDEAEGAFRRALALDDKLDRAWYGLGLTLIRLGRFDDAVIALERNTQLQPMSPYGWYQLARVHLDRQDPDAARRVIRHLRGFEPKVAAQFERETGLAV